MAKKTMITIATTGAWPTKENNPNVPMTPAEISEDVVVGSNPTRGVENCKQLLTVFHFIGNSEGTVSMIFIRTPYVESVKFKYNKRFSLI